MVSTANRVCSGCSFPCFSAVVRTPTPMGLVKNKLSPDFAVLFCLRLSKLTLPVTAKPKIGSWVSMEWPPAR